MVNYFPLLVHIYGIGLHDTNIYSSYTIFSGVGSSLNYFSFFISRAWFLVVYCDECLFDKNVSPKHCLGTRINSITLNLSYAGSGYIRLADFTSGADNENICQSSAG